FMFWPNARIGFTAFGAKVDEGGYIAPPLGQSATVRFTDGSEVVLDAGSRGRIAELGAHGGRIVVESGRAHFRIEHLPKAAWSVAAGHFVVHVMGTEFDVTWSPSDQVLDVVLTKGAVTVDTPGAREGIQLEEHHRLVASASTGEVHITPADAGPSPRSSSSAL